MKLNHDCIRDFLLYFEANTHLNEDMSYEDINHFEIKTSYSSDDIIYTIQKLNEANYLKAKFYYASDSVYNLSVSSITWEGHKFLDTIRDDKVWKNTKSVISKFSSVSVTIVEKVASTVLTNLISKQMGL